MSNTLKIVLLMLCAGFATAGFARQVNVSDTSLLGNNPKAGNYARIRGINMYYETYGEGTPLLIIHGNSGSIADFSKQVPFFSKYYKVIVTDSRDHGKTLDTLHMQDSLSYEMMADDYSALLTHLKIDSCNVLGWSDGGIIGLLLAMRCPDKIKKLAIMGANLWPDTNAVKPFVLKYFTLTNQYIKAGKPGVERDVLLRHFNLVLNQPHIAPEQLSQIKCPTLVMAGDHDVIQVKHTALIAESIPKSNLWIAPNAGHGLSVFEYSDKFNMEVNEFYKRPYKAIEGYELFKH